MRFDKLSEPKVVEGFSERYKRFSYVIRKIKTNIVTGFLDAGKTTYIQSFITRDFFHKKENGKTLILAFESGETEYDTDLLKDYGVNVAYWNGEDLPAFIRDSVEKYKPDRVFAEVNVMTAGMVDLLKDMLDIKSTTMLIDATTLEIYYRNIPQIMSDMIKISDPVIINRAVNKEKLQPYGSSFRLLNPKAGFLWESPMGYHEKVFGNALPYDRNQPHLQIGEKDYPLWYLDCLEFPGDYKGKVTEAVMQIKQDTEPDHKGGRDVMTCCMNDIQFLGFKLKLPEGSREPQDNSFYQIKAKISTEYDNIYKKDIPVLEVVAMEKAPPQELISVRK